MPRRASLIDRPRAKPLRRRDVDADQLTIANELIAKQARILARKVLKRALPTSDVYRVADLTALIGVSRATVYRMVEAGDFPRPIKLSARAIGWRRRDVEAWIAARGHPTGPKGTHRRKAP